MFDFFEELCLVIPPLLLAIILHKIGSQQSAASHLVETFESTKEEELALNESYRKSLVQISRPTSLIRSIDSVEMLITQGSVEKK